MNLLKFIFTLSRTHSWSVLYCPLPSFRICKTKRIHGLPMEKFLLLDHLKFTVILHIGVLSRNATCGLWELQGVHMCTYAALAIISASQFTIIHCCLKLDYWHIIVPKNWDLHFCGFLYGQPCTFNLMKHHQVSTLWVQCLALRLWKSLLRLHLTKETMCIRSFYV